MQGFYVFSEQTTQLVNSVRFLVVCSTLWVNQPGCSIVSDAVIEFKKWQKKEDLVLLITIMWIIWIIIIIIIITTIIIIIKGQSK